MRVLLIQPDQDRTRGFQQMARVEPLGLEMIAGALTDRHEVVLLDLRLGSEALAPTLHDFRPQLVGISSSFTTDIYRTVEVAQVAKQADPGTFVVVGGHHPSLRPQDFWHPAVDAIVVGEGEVTARELVACLESGGDPARVPGLVLNREEGQRFTLPRPFIENLDLLPHPRRSLTRTYRRHYFQVLTRPIALVETARGCPYRCRFCSVWHFYQGKVRFKSPRRVVEELMEVEEPHVLFTDDNFLADTNRAAEIAGLIKERGIRKGYQIQARSDAIVKHPELIAQWQEVGLGGVFIGFEKPDQVRLDAENKHNSVENNEGALEVLRRQGIEPTVSFIVDPEYDRSDFATLRAYVHRLKLRWPTFSVLTPLPGTALFEQTKEQLTTNNYELFDLLHAVLPTWLPLAEFYDELAGLWRTAYPLWKQRAAGVYLFLRELCSRDPSPACWRMALAEGRRLIEARTYLADLSLCRGTASTQPI